MSEVSDRVFSQYWTETEIRVKKKKKLISSYFSLISHLEGGFGNDL